MKLYMPRLLSKTFRYLPVFVLLVVIISGYIFIRQHDAKIANRKLNSSRKENEAKGTIGKKIKASTKNFSIEVLANYTNIERSKASVGALNVNKRLNISASAKCKDMADRNYWSHTAPDNTEPWAFMKQAGYSYSDAGENLAYGFSENSEIIKGWMNSKSHKANMLNPVFTEVGFGICDSKNYQKEGHQVIIVQHLGAPHIATVSSQASASTKPSNYTNLNTDSHDPIKCSKTPIPYKTIYIDANYMYVGESTEYGGVDGYKETCTGSSGGYRPSDFTLPPLDKKIYRGTKPRQSTGSSGGANIAPAPTCVQVSLGGWEC